MLPQRRLELLLAQVSLVLAKIMGGDKTSTLSDFLFDPKNADADELTGTGEADLKDLAELLGATVYRSRRDRTPPPEE